MTYTIKPYKPWYTGIESELDREGVKFPLIIEPEDASYNKAAVYHLSLKGYECYIKGDAIIVMRKKELPMDYSVKHERLVIDQLNEYPEGVCFDHFEGVPRNKLRKILKQLTNRGIVVTFKERTSDKPGRPTIFYTIKKDSDEN